MNAVSRSLGDAFLLGQFRAFYALLVEQKQLTNANAWPEAALTASAPEDVSAPEAAPQDPADDAPAKSSAAAISSTLLEALERGAKSAAVRGGSYGSSLYREAQYVMAAVADDVFLNSLQWDGQTSWQNNLLEARLFDSYIAGERIFDKIDELLAANSNANADLAAIYLEALSLGFRGKYFGMDDQGAIDVYRHGLFKLIAKRSTSEAQDLPIFAQAYAHTLDHGRGRKLPYIRKWVWMLVTFFVLFLGVSHVLWISAIAEINTIIENIS